MGSTYRFQDAVIAAAEVSPRGMENAKNSMACNLALNKIWEAHDWREAMADLPPFYLRSLVQDYGAPFVDVPADFLGLRKAYLYNLQGSINGLPYQTDMTVVADLSTTMYVPLDQKFSICYFEPKQCFRIHPAPPTGYCAPWWMVDGKYKKRPTVRLSSDGTTINKITSGNIANALLPFDDMYFEVWVLAMQWAYMVLNGDMQRAGGVQMQGRNKAYFGQLGAVMAAVSEMAANEADELGDPVSYPRESLIGSNMYGYGW